jgi:hypothetical protein
VQKHKLSGIASDPAEAADFLQRLPVEQMHLAIAGIGEEEILLPRIRRERDGECRAEQTRFAFDKDLARMCRRC